METNHVQDLVFWVFLFGTFWIIAFIISVESFTVAATACLWYFSGQGSDTAEAQDTSGVGLGLGWAFKYHMGSLALGSFLIALITLIKIIFEYYVKKCEAIAGENSDIYKILTCCMRCCIWCLDSCIKFISENAYIQVALKGSTFCEGAHYSFYMMVRHPGTFASSEFIGWIMVAIGKGAICGSMTYVTLLLAQQKVLSEKVQQPFVPAAVILMFSFVVSSLFLTLFDYSALAIL